MIDQPRGNKYISLLLSVTGIILLSKILGLCKQVLTASFFGATFHTDIISISEGLVANIDYLVIQALSTAFVPIYINIDRNNPIAQKRFVSEVSRVFFFITFFISLFLFLTSSFVARILAPSYLPEQSIQLSKYIKIVAPAIIILVEVAIFNSLLKANEKFIPGELIAGLQSVIIIVLVVLFGKQYGPDILVIGFYLYAIIGLILLLFSSRHFWGLNKEMLSLDDNIRRLLHMMVPLLFGYSMVFVNQQVDRVIVSGLGAGTITSMSYAAVLSNFIGTFIGSVCGVLYTYMSQKVANNDEKGVASLSVQFSIQMITLLLPISILTIANSSDIVRIVFGHGRFDQSAITNCALALMGYGCMFVPLALRELFSRFQYAYGDSRRPMINASIGIIFNIAFSIILSRFIGVLGVTIATSISVIVCAALNIYSSCQKNAYIKLYEYIAYIPRWLLGIIICFIFSFTGGTLLVGLFPLVRFLIITLISLMVYGLVNYSVIKPLVVQMIKKK